MSDILKTRELVSFDGNCPYNCKHCYTFGLNEENKNLTIDDIVKSLENKDFDVIYVSHNKENFLNPSEGIKLCRELFNKYNRDIIAITRNVFNDNEIDDLVKLNNEMKDKGKMFFLAVSIPALESISVTESSELIPSPKERIDFLKRAKQKRLTTLLTIRPLYPNNIISIEEPLKIIDECKDFVDCVLSSGLAVNDTILKQLNMEENQFEYLNGENSDFLIGAVDNDIKYIDVKKEIAQIRNKCENLNIPFFDHSMSALNFLKGKSYE